MLQDAARKAGFAASIGVTGGKEFAGLFGPDRHMEHTVIGDAVNRTAAPFAFRDGVAGVVAERFASLAPAPQLSLKVAAVLGRTFDLDLSSQLHPAGTARAALADKIAAAQRAGLVEPSDAEGGKQCFHHAIINDTAYKPLVSDQRRKLHAKTAALQDARGAARASHPQTSLQATRLGFAANSRLPRSIGWPRHGQRQNGERITIRRRPCSGWIRPNVP